MQVGLKSLKVALCADGRHSGQVRAGVAMSDLFPFCVVVNPSFFFPFLVIDINIDNIQRSKWLHLQKYKKDTENWLHFKNTKKTL